MKDINRPKYKKVKQLLQSKSPDDVKIGVELLKKYNFSYEDYLYNFPNSASKRDFRGNCTYLIWASIDKIDLVISSEWIYAIDSNISVNWHRDHKTEF